MELKEIIQHLLQNTEKEFNKSRFTDPRDESKYWLLWGKIEAYKEVLKFLEFRSCDVTFDKPLQEPVLEEE